MRGKSWKTELKEASDRLIKCASDAAASLGSEDMTVRDIKDLASTLKELSTLRSAVTPPDSRAGAKQDAASIGGLSVTFTDEGEDWSL